jgi:hypothetical protein
VSYSCYSLRSRDYVCRSYILFLLLLIVATCASAAAESIHAKTLPCALTQEEAEGLNADASIDIHAVDTYSRTMYSLLKAGEFEKLDCLADAARAHKETFPGGLWKIHAVYADLVKPPLHATEDDWTSLIDLLQRWVTARPGSITARVALAESYVGYAWQARGTGTGDTVSESGWKLFADRIAKAKQILDQASSLKTQCPEWYVAMQNVALGQSWKASDSRDLLERAVKFEPGYYYYYRLYAKSIMPQWGGEEGEVAQFLQKTADRIGGDAGDILYFRVAGILVCGCQSDQKLNLSWARILKGFDAVEKLDGPSQENLNRLAQMAVSFRDAVVAQKSFTRIGDQWSVDVWKDISSYESAKQWAKQAEPLMARTRAAEDSAQANLLAKGGKGYYSAFAEKVQTLMKPCMEGLAGSDLGEFELLIKVGKEGTIDEITGSGHSPLMSCLGQKINDFRRSKEAVFPAPPQPDYWVRFDLKSESSTSALLK